MRNRDNNKEILKITVSMGYIAALLTIFLGIDNIKSLGDLGGNLIILVRIFSLLIILVFFLYVTFTALEYTSGKKKKVDFYLFEDELGVSQIRKIKEKLFDLGVKLVIYAIGAIPILFLFMATGVMKWWCFFPVLLIGGFFYSFALLFFIKHRYGISLLLIFMFLIFSFFTVSIANEIKKLKVEYFDDIKTTNDLFYEKPLQDNGQQIGSWSKFSLYFASDRFLGKGDLEHEDD